MFGINPPERRNDFIGETVGQVFVLGIGAKIIERQHSKHNPRWRLIRLRASDVDRRKETIAALGDCLNEPVFLRSISQRFAQLRDILRQRCFLNEAIRPQPLQELVLFDKVPLALHQQQQGLEDLRLQQHGLAGAEQLLVGGK